MRATLTATSSALLMFPALCLLPDMAVSQPVVTVPDAVACSSCSIVLRSTTVLGSLEDTEKFPSGFPARVQRDDRGRYWLFSNSAPPALFDSSGRFLRMLGRTGQGPGEYTAPHMALFLEDSVVVLDARQYRASVLNSELEYVRSLRMPSQMYWALVISWPDSIVAADHSPNPKSIGWPLHLTSFARNEGEVVTSFGPGEGSARPSDMFGIPWFLTPAGTGIWAAPTSSYTLVKWKREDLTIAETLKRDPSWFHESHGTLGGPAVDGRPARPPSPRLAGIEEDSEGLLWTYVHVPGPNWKEAWEHIKPIAPGEVRLEDIGMDKFYRTRIEVIDSKSRRVLARTTLDGFFVVNALNEHRVAVYASHPERGEIISVLEFDLVRSRR